MKLDLGALRNAPLHERAYNVLRGSLRSGRFPMQGSVSLRALSEEFEISVTPVREAVQRLIAEGTLELTPTRRIRVPAMTQDLYREIISIRLKLEPLAAVAALVRADDALLKQLSDIRVIMGQAIGAGAFDDYLAANESFHFCLYRASQQTYLVQIIDQCWLRIGPWLAALSQEGRFLSVANTEHDHMIRAITEWDEKVLVDALVRDIAGTAEALLPYLPQIADKPVQSGRS